MTVLLVLVCLLASSFSSGRGQSSGAPGPRCRSPLGVSSGAVKDTKMTASSSFSPASVGAENGRLGTERGGGAWCPAHLISRASEHQWLEVELAREMMVTGVITQGRYAGGQGVEFAELVSVQVMRDGDWVTVVEEAAANRDTYSKVEILLGAGVVTRRVRVIPVSEHPRMVCLRIELLGCSAEDLIISTTAFSNLADSDKIEVIKDNSIQQTDKRERGTPKQFGSSNKKSEPMIKSQGSKPINEIDQRSVITKLEEDRGVISVRDNTDNETQAAISDTETSDDSEDSEDNEAGGMVSITSSEGQYMLVSVVVLVSIIVILIITIIFILYKNYQFTHSKALTTDSDTLESSYPLYSARTLDSSHQVYSNSVQATPYKQRQSNYNSSVTSFQGHYPAPHTHSLGQSPLPGHQARQTAESHYSNSNYYATTDLIQWHNRKYLGGGRPAPGPVDL